jgi:hypothetical protein
MSLDLTGSVVVLLGGATPSPTPVRTIDPARVTPGLLGLASLLFLVIAGYFLARSMIKQFKKIDFDEDATELGIARPEQRNDPAPAAAAIDAVDGTQGGTAT